MYLSHACIIYVFLSPKKNHFLVVYQNVWWKNKFPTADLNFLGTDWIRSRSVLSFLTTILPSDLLLVRVNN